MIASLILIGYCLLLDLIAIFFAVKPKPSVGGFSLASFISIFTKIVLIGVKIRAKQLTIEADLSFYGSPLFALGFCLFITLVYTIRFGSSALKRKKFSAPYERPIVVAANLVLLVALTWIYCR